MDLKEKHFHRTAAHAAHLAKHSHAIVAETRNALGMKKGAKADLGQLDVESLVEALDRVLEHVSEMGDGHGDYAEHCTACAKEAGESAAAEAEKSARARLTRTDVEPIPAGFTKLAPANPDLTAVPRFGQQPLPTVDKSKIPLELQKVFAGGDERETVS